MKYILIVIFLLLSLLCISQNPVDNIIPVPTTTDTCKQTISNDSLIKDINETSNAVRLYGKQQVVVNYISIVSFTVVIVGTILGIPTSPLLLTTGLCDFATLLVSGHSARKLAHRKLKPI